MTIVQTKRYFCITSIIIPIIGMCGSGRYDLIMFNKSALLFPVKKNIMS